MAHRVVNNSNINVSNICEVLNMSRQNFYKSKHIREKEFINETLVLHLVHDERAFHPRIGTRKLFFLIKERCLQNDIKIGRDKLFSILKKNNLLITKTISSPKTTDSRHRLSVYSNLISDITVSRPNEVWVSDITYIRTIEGFMYASIITDSYSRKIIGYYVGDSLETYGCVNALHVALKTIKNGIVPIHHSDRGCQYCSYQYIEILDDNKISISMTEKNHCYENAKAERVNGILKQEYLIGSNFKTKEQAKASFVQAVYLYNNKRPHLKLDYRTPSEVYERAC